MAYLREQGLFSDNVVIETIYMYHQIPAVFMSFEVRLKTKWLTTIYQSLQSRPVLTNPDVKII